LIRAHFSISLITPGVWRWPRLYPVQLAHGNFRLRSFTH
jgi:hypothetical protein